MTFLKSKHFNFFIRSHLNVLIVTSDKVMSFSKLNATKNISFFKWNFLENLIIRSFIKTV